MKSFETLSPAQLRRAAELKEKIESLTSELNKIFGGSTPAGVAAPKKDRRRRKMSPAAKAKLSAKLKIAWARRKSGASAAPAAKKNDGRRRPMSPAAKAKLSAKLKAAWARRKAAKQK
ncbi:MAG: hypothetical protein HZA89_04165 [Verrucomicrobia bacterium]|nr:hypothetical protein [Verrucomicrobiota bacterium]